MTDEVNCAVECVNGCVLGDKCPHREHAESAVKFIAATPLEDLLEMAEKARLKKLTEPPKWVIPDDF